MWPAAKTFYNTLPLEMFCCMILRILIWRHMSECLKFVMCLHNVLFQNYNKIDGLYGWHLGNWLNYALLLCLQGNALHFFVSKRLDDFVCVCFLGCFVLDLNDHWAIWVNYNVKGTFKLYFRNLQSNWIQLDWQKLVYVNTQ